MLKEQAPIMADNDSLSGPTRMAKVRRTPFLANFRIADDSGVNDDNGFSRSDPGGPVVHGRRTRGNELVVWIDDEKRRDLFAEPRCGKILAPTRTAPVWPPIPRNRSTEDLSGFWFRP